jgi:hypothetical protein
METQITVVDRYIPLAHTLPSLIVPPGKEKEVLSMENGGNGKVNAIFEARLAQSGAQKPITHADGPTRERFIRDKYERRKYYDPAAFSLAAAQAPAPREMAAPQAAQPGPPSDAARQRMEERKRRLKKSNSIDSTDSQSVGSQGSRSKSRGPPRRTNSGRPAHGRVRRPATAKAPASAPAVSIDLLDLMEDPAPSHGNNAQAAFHESFKTDTGDIFDFLSDNTSPAPAAAAAAAPSFDTAGRSGAPRRSNSGRGGSSGTGSRTNPPVKKQSSSSASEDILSLYNSSAPAQSFADVNNMTSSMQQINFNQQQPNNMMQQQQPNNRMGQQQQQQPMMNQQQQLLYQQQMMMMQQQQRQQQMMMMQQNGGGGGGMMPGANMGMMQQPGMAQQQQQNNGFGAPMGSGPPVSTIGGSGSRKAPAVAEKEDPFGSFAQFGHNAFSS